MARESAGAPALDLENYKKFYGFGIPKWSPYYYVTEDDDEKNAETIRRFKEEGGGSMPRFTSHEELKGHLVNMSDTELNRMRDFGCGKPHWSPYYVDPAYTFESRAIDGDKVSMMMTRPLAGEEGYISVPNSSRAGSKPPSARSTARGATPTMAPPDPMKNTDFRMPSARSSTSKASASARSTASQRAAALKAVQKSARESEAKKIEEKLREKEMEIAKLKEELEKTRGSARD
ncbi:hypothetical protein TrCOL_g4125 [Triparma columacea]|nr:hypothetical protein TrCOL_g4125 [Triparma columacea]